MRWLLCMMLALVLALGSGQPARAATISVSNATELAAAIASAQGGDVILLQNASYGALTVNSRNPSGIVTIRAAAGATPVFTQVRIQNSSRWTIAGVEVKPRYATGADGTTAVVLDGDQLTLENSRINFADDVGGWSADDWVARTGNGVSLDGANLVVRNNSITAIDHGINSSATDTRVSGNVIAAFRGDGIRGLGDRTVYEYNTIKNAYAVDDNHDDGFQSWSFGPGGVGTGVVRDVVLRGNTIINYEDPNQPHRGNLQGIGLFDGMFENWVVENNLVVTDHWHGISFYGAVNCRIINNTVIDNNPAPSPDPWIMVHDHKNGTPSSGVLVRNNLANDFSLEGGYTADHNLEITMAAAPSHFVNPSGGTGDYHLLATSPARDAGSSTGAPTVDRDGLARPQGAGWDIGAFEWKPALVARAMPADRALHLSWSADNPLPVGLTWRIVYAGPIGDRASPIAGLTADTRTFSLTGLTNHTPYTVIVNGVVAGTPVMTDTVTAMPAARVIVLPSIRK